MKDWGFLPRRVRTREEAARTVARSAGEGAGAVTPLEVISKLPRLQIIALSFSTE